MGKRLAVVVAFAGGSAALSSCSLLPPTVDDLPGDYVLQGQSVASSLTLSADGALTVNAIPESVFEQPGDDFDGAVDLVGSCRMEILGQDSSPYIFCTIEATGNVMGVTDKLVVGGSGNTPVLSFVSHRWGEAELFTYGQLE